MWGLDGQWAVVLLVCNAVEVFFLVIELQVQAMVVLLFGVDFGIGKGVSLGIGVGGASLGFLLIPALPCQILDFGMGGTMFVGCPLSIGCV